MTETPSSRPVPAPSGTTPTRTAPSKTSAHSAADRLLPEFYRTLKTIAANHLRGERPNHTLDPTALVHEAYLRLAGQLTLGLRDRSQLLGVASVLMRRILVDHARTRNAEKRGHSRSTVSLDRCATRFEERSVDLLALNDALRQLRRRDPRKARIVELRFFGGLTVEETGALLSLSRRTVERDWTFARAWLRNEIDLEEED